MKPVLTFMFRPVLFLLLLLLSSVPGAAIARGSFAVDYRVELRPARGDAQVVIATKPVDGRLIRLKMALPQARYLDLRGNGEIERDGELVTWTPPAQGGTFRYRVRIDHRRRGAGFDARITDDWALLRGDVLFPPMQATVTRGVDSRARLRFVLPVGWSAVTPYSSTGDGKTFVVVDSERRMDRPKGWMLFGKIGVRRDTIAGSRIAVAAPVGQGARSGDLLAFITAIAPEAQRAFGKLPSRLLVVQAGDPMWRGGLSGPRSIYLHLERPLISGNGSSTPAHELVHVVTRLSADAGDDWIVEGLAEYYSIELTRRAGLLSRRRADKALDWMRAHGRGVIRLQTSRSSGKVTARAVVLFADLDAEIRAAGDHSLDDVVRKLMRKRQVSRAALRAAVSDVLGRESRTLRSTLLD